MRTSAFTVSKAALVALLLSASAAFGQINITATSGGGGGGGMNTNASNATSAAFPNIVNARTAASARSDIGLGSTSNPTFGNLTVTSCTGCGSGITQLTGGVTAGPGSGSQAATVVTNANLTGPITSVGNATAIASQTGTGTKFVVDNGPTLIAPILGAATATTINKVTLTQPASGSTLTIADGKVLTDTSGVGAVLLKGATGGGFAAAVAADIPATTLATGTSVSLTAPRQYYVCTSTCTVTPPVPAAGYEFCVMNDDNVATVITLAALGSSAMYEATARTSYGTAGTGTLVSGGAAKDQVCIVGRDSTHYLTVSSTGTWTAS